MSTLDYLKILATEKGISGREDNVREYMKKELEKYCDSIETDKFGNLIAKKGSTGPKIMIASHMDEIGLMVKYIDDKGFLKFTKIGGINDQMLLNQKVIVHGNNGDIVGVLGSKPPHKMKESERNKLISAEHMFIDIGAKNREEAEKMGVEIGTAMSFKSEFDKLGGNVVSCKSFDNRAGCAVVLKTMELLKDVDLKCQVYAVGTVQEEVGLKGAKTSAFGINPDVAFALDVTICGDHPGIKLEDAPVELGKGPVATIVDASGRGIITHPTVLRMVRDVAKEDEIPVQYEVGEGGTTDATAIHLTRDGIPTGVISVPSRYIHTPVEVIDTEDLEKTTELVVACIKKVHEYF
ncbi:M42 family metallopeptidase [Methanococcus maripaludis]|uniref:Aminopeptidase n=2 Tax=Methanococcus maripaludis TaxID=39152 RepID=A0A2Z5PHW9_METMI|nr:M42 family metallopeptidase [Methanococcus maripaludis]MDK2928860.1 tetrahedral aminopeptidase [Methanococcus sp.]BAP61406.1 aminopeptidase [Methanococcus maripaludis KA1]BAP63310.1 aminopeptidase [Methanococcus maripaludis OS7]